MRIYRYSLICLFGALTSSAYALEAKPWIGNAYEFELLTAFSYYRFHKVEGASVQLTSPLNTYVLLVDLGFAPSPVIDFQLEGEFAQSHPNNWAMRSTALQARYQMLDDISGDPVSLTVGLNVRAAPHHLLTNVSTPYASELNFELTGSVGKEWSQDGCWNMRAYGMAAIGQANRGYPWMRDLFVWQYNLQDTHRFTVFAESNFGFGGKQHVNVKHFNGWAKVQHQSIDIGLAYGYKMGVYGLLTAAYAYRLFAHNYPQRVNFFMISYCLPFSLF